MSGVCFDLTIFPAFEYVAGKSAGVVVVKSHYCLRTARDEFNDFSVGYPNGSNIFIAGDVFGFRFCFVSKMEQEKNIKRTDLIIPLPPLVLLMMPFNAHAKRGTLHRPFNMLQTNQSYR
ncbi:hypothetical protein LQ318_09030 [Aliifodinibius salicampi]|uniref:CN hydrolase domain-containing protein n=1 Tax=Fodinibius salicampi TaxID=1920655 RepID=A0ABT3PYY1_9BACT|nr:hypothetical protein [Fodinibius salicampi]MCW9713046.1 hypothetical protein [Fodinibius salicampi]